MFPSVRSSTVRKQTAACVQLLETLCDIEDSRLKNASAAESAEQKWLSSTVVNPPDQVAEAYWETAFLKDSSPSLSERQNLLMQRSVEERTVLQAGQQHTPRVQPWYLLPKTPAVKEPFKRQRIFSAEHHPHFHPHISLSRLVTLQYHLLTSFVGALKSALRHMRRYSNKE